MSFEFPKGKTQAELVAGRMEKAAQQSATEGLEEEVVEDEIDTSDGGQAHAGEDSVDNEDDRTADEPDGVEEVATAADQDEDEQEDSSQDDDSTDDAEVDFLDLDDDVLLDVSVDGEEMEVSLADLKREYSGNKAIETRLRETTEAQNQVISQGRQALEYLAEQEQQVLEIMEGLDSKLLPGIISAPPEDLRRTNPSQYLKHQEAYEEDQRRVQASKDELAALKKTIQDQATERRKQYAEKSVQFLNQALPELINPETSAATFKMLADTARLYGFQDTEINSAMDPRLYVAMRDLAEFRKVNTRAKEEPADEVVKKVKKVRKLRTGSAHASGRRTTNQQKQLAALRKKANATGKQADVTAYRVAKKRMAANGR